ARRVPASCLPICFGVITDAAAAPAATIRTPKNTSALTSWSQFQLHGHSARARPTIRTVVLILQAPMVEERSKRRLAAILAADVVGYSRLMEADEAGTFAALKARR